jgi:hypothetical protein
VVDRVEPLAGDVAVGYSCECTSCVLADLLAIVALLDRRSHSYGSAHPPVRRRWPRACGSEPSPSSTVATLLHTPPHT